MIAPVKKIKPQYSAARGTHPSAIFKNQLSNQILIGSRRAALTSGIGIIASMAFNPAKDSDLHMLSGEHLFGANTTYIALRRGHYLHSFAYRFIELCSPALPEAAIRAGAVAIQGN
ncbi:MAG: hypothetical protein A2342_01810 [Gallionellales bacterium RIFOXYB12_FULL_54_9]|nr:MAG: hypothetical protein A2342_01810 [Gallionellales bacterium RIFOXYB12_FULL_54_9]